MNSGHGIKRALQTPLKDAYKIWSKPKPKLRKNESTPTIIHKKQSDKDAKNDNQNL